MAPAHRGTDRLFVLNVWHPTTGWVRHEFPTDTARRVWAEHQAMPGADLRWSDR